MNNWLRENLVCPRDKQKLRTKENSLICPENHVYPIIDDIPVMLVGEEERIHNYIGETLETIAGIQSSELPTDEPTANSEKVLNAEREVDEYVQSEIPLTCGNLYMGLRHKLTRYPIPELRRCRAATAKSFSMPVVIGDAGRLPPRRTVISQSV